MKLSDNFTRKEFSCKCGCGFNTVDAELLFVLIKLRHHFNNPVTIRSAARCKIHNANAGGGKKSQHLLGKAADITVNNTHADKVAAYLEMEYPTKYGIGRYNGRTHIDVRENPARWDNRIKN